MVVFAHEKEDLLRSFLALPNGIPSQRQCFLQSATEVLSPQLLSQWLDVKTIIKVVATRTIKGIVKEDK